MDVEVREVRDFLAGHEPFSALDAASLSALARQLQVRYFRRGTVLMTAGGPNDHLYILRAGATDIVDTDGSLVERTEAGGSFGASSLLARAPSRYTITAIEDSLVLVMDAAVFDDLVARHDEVRQWYEQLREVRMRRAVARQQATDEGQAGWLRTRVAQVACPDVVACPPHTSIREAAALMTQRHVSALLVVDEDRLVGIVTDRDMRSKVVATGLPVDEPLAAVMTPDPVHVTADTQAFEALLEMTTRGVHHLPVLDGRRVAGVVSAGDLVRLQQADPVFLAGDISRQQDVAGLAGVAARTPMLAARLLDQGASCHDTARLLTTVADALTRRLVHLATDELGPAPGPWAWVVLGSQARRELSVASDQDHALFVADGVLADPAARRWFAELSTRVADGLERCGFPRCPGDVMATNPRWCLEVGQWRGQFLHWTNEPDPQAVLHCQIFFDARTVHGDPGLLAAVRRDVLAVTPQSRRFLGQLAAHAVERQPPLGFFRGRVLARRGEQHESFDLKAHGVHAVIELARVHALAHGIDEVGTQERLLAVAHQSSGASLVDLAEAFEFLGHVRLVHQVAQAREGRVPDNIVQAGELSAFERRHLKDAFALVRQAQEGLSYAFQTHLMT